MDGVRVDRRGRHVGSGAHVGRLEIAHRRRCGQGPALLRPGAPLHRPARATHVPLAVHPVNPTLGTPSSPTHDHYIRRVTHWAALLALHESLSTRCSCATQSIYELNDLTDITAGSNGTFQAQHGYDLCTGLGVPNAAVAAAWLKQNGVSYSPPTAAPPAGSGASGAGGHKEHGGHKRHKGHKAAEGAEA